MFNISETTALKILNEQLGMPKVSADGFYNTSNLKEIYTA